MECDVRVNVVKDFKVGGSVFGVVKRRGWWKIFFFVDDFFSRVMEVYVEYYKVCV